MKQTAKLYKEYQEWLEKENENMVRVDLLEEEESYVGFMNWLIEVKYKL